MVAAELLSNAPGCLMLALRVQHADADSCAQKLDRLNTLLEGFEGFTSLDVIRRDGGLGTDFYLIARFRSVEALDAWRTSPERFAQVSEIEAMAITDISRQRAAGSNIWFQPIVTLPNAPKPPLFWKRWLTSMLAVYPALIVLVTILDPLTSHLPRSLALFIIALILTGLTTAFVVPWLTRTLHHWLVAR